MIKQTDPGTGAAVIRRRRRACHWRTAAGVLILVAVAMRAGRERARLAGSGQRPGPAAGTGLHGDCFWKAGLVYLNRGDPASMAATRFGAGWTFNLGNPAAWLIIAAIIATPAGLAVIRIAAGM